MRTCGITPVIPEDVLILSGEDGLKTMQLITNIYGRAEWPKNFTSVSRPALKKSQKLQNAETITQSDSLHIQQKW
jgi:predicted DNA-binding ribbon-helix-helix protein